MRKVVNERGQILRFKRMALESYPVLTTSLFPPQSIIDKEIAWLGYASGPVGQALNKVVNTIGNTANNVIQAGSGAVSGILSFGQNVMPNGSQIVTSSVAGWRVEGRNHSLLSLTFAR